MGEFDIHHQKRTLEKKLAWLQKTKSVSPADKKFIFDFDRDKKRFEPIKDVKQDDLIIYELEGDPKKILQISGTYYLLDNDECQDIKK